MRRFRFTFVVGIAAIFGSEATSKYTLVKTTVGISLYPSDRLEVMEPADWNAKSAMGISSRKRGPPVNEASSEVCGMRSPSIRATAMITRRDWSTNERKRVPRRRAPASRVRLERMKAPTKNDAIEQRDLSQPQGLLVG
jgi:hypothetical protein